jgi:hypothetical protein
LHVRHVHRRRRRLTQIVVFRILQDADNFSLPAVLDAPSEPRCLPQ